MFNNLDPHSEFKLAVSYFLSTGDCRFMAIQFREGFCMETHLLSSLNTIQKSLGDLLSFLTGSYLEL